MHLLFAFAWSCLVLLAGVLGSDDPRQDGDSRAALIDGVTTIAAPGSPGAIACWSQKAVVVVVGKDDGQDVPVVACSRHGKGRVVLLSHTGYFDKNSLNQGQTARLLLNAVRWAGGEVATGGLRVGTVGAPDVLGLLTEAGITATDVGKSWERKLDAVDVLILAGGVTSDQASIAQSFMARGGGFITAQCGWGWKQLSGDKDMLDFAINHAVAPAGLAFTDGFASTTADGAFDATAQPGAFSHGGMALDAILSQAQGNEQPHLSPRDQAAAGSSAMRALRVLPVTDRAYRPRVDSLVRARADELAPSEQRPLNEKEHALDRFLLAYQVDDLRTLAPGRVPAHASAETFPGKVPAGARSVTRSFRIDTAVPDWHSLGLYARAGDVISIVVPASAASARLGVRIGCHTDELWHHGEWKRVPRIATRVRVEEPRTQVASPYGGLVYIDVPRGCKLGVINITVEGAVEAPLFVLGTTDPAEWRESIRHAPGPWAELATSKVIVTVPSEHVRAVDDPGAVLEFWDRIMDAAADLASIPRPRERPERYVADVQISAGYMHSGYPIMTHLDAGAWLANLAELRSGNWGLYHELGHNHQEGAWTFDGTGEVTCNLFCLYIHDTLCEGGRTDSRRWLAQRQGDIAKYLARGARYETWKSEPFTALAMYIQLQQAFGWDTFKRVFAEYRDLPGDQRPRDDAQKRDQWMVRFSRACGRNLGPFFQAWGVPTSQSARDQIASLPAWMPEGWPPE